MIDFSTLLTQLTVDCKDNGKQFTQKDRLNAIEKWLADSSYKLIYQGELSVVYGKKPLGKETHVVISSHVDCVYNQLFCKELSDALWSGTFDNSLTNAALVYNMCQEAFSEHVAIAFTGDEELDSNGALEVMKELERTHCRPELVIVTDVTEEGWEEESPFTIENDLNIDLWKAHRIVNLLSGYKYPLIHEAEPDESWDYAKEGYPCLTFSIPILGDMHNDYGVIARKKHLPTYCEAIAVLANKM